MKREIITIAQSIPVGPAMTALTELQRAFVVAYNNAGGKNASEAARAAGYQDTDNLGSNTSHLLHHPKIQAAIREDLSARFVGDAAEARIKLLGMMRDPGPHQLNATKAVLHHAGMIEKNVVEVTHTHILTYEQKVDELKRLAMLTGDNLDELLAGVVETDATELQPEDPEFW